MIYSTSEVHVIVIFSGFVKSLKLTLAKYIYPFLLKNLGIYVSLKIPLIGYAEQEMFF